MNPVLAALEREGKISDNDLQFLLDHGRSYEGVRLPAWIARRRPGTCLDTADDLEAEGEGKFIRGFGLLFGSNKPLGHAWVTKDGRTAIDAVWPRPQACSYWGLPRRFERRVAAMVRLPFFSIPY